jgi:hypothetical protein
MKVRIFLSCGLRELIAFQGATDELLTSQNRFDSRPKIALDVHLINVTLSARAQSCSHDVEVTVLTQEDNLGAGREWSYLRAASIPFNLGRPISSRMISGFRSWTFWPRLKHQADLVSPICGIISYENSD